MAQSIQIVPSYSFPYVEVIINDYSQVTPDVVDDEVDNSIKQVYAFASPKGKDNKFVKRSSRAAAVNTFGDSNFKKYGQPLLQALDAADVTNSTVWMMRVMPENATYANALVYAYYKADTADDYEAAHKRKFRIKHTFKSIPDIKTMDELKAEAAKPVDPDESGFAGKEFMMINSAGRGKYGDWYSLRASQNMNYEKDYGISMYNFEILSTESGLEREATYVGGVVTSAKYKDQLTLINDVVESVGNGLIPVEIAANEDDVEEIYAEYIAFINQLRTDVQVEYDEAVAAGVPEEELLEIYNVLISLDADNIPDVDEFDIINGNVVASSVEIPGLRILKPLTDDVDTEAEDYDPNDYVEPEPLVVIIDGAEVTYSNTNLVDFTSAKGLPIYFGSNGYFDNPRTTVDPITGEVIQWTYEDELELCLNNAFNGTYDDAILSKNRLPYRFLVDANYPDSVKKTLYNLAETRNSGRLYLDANVIEAIGTAQVRTLVDRFRYADDRIASIDISSYVIREMPSNKKRTVTATYYIATHLPVHILNIGEHVPFTYDNAQLDGVRDSLIPMLSDNNADIKDLLAKNRFNYFECVAENQYQRTIQNTRQTSDSDLLEENNVLTLYTLKRLIEAETRSELYDFSDASTRKDFETFINNKYSEWNGTQVQSIDFKIRTSAYEFKHSILHGYLAVVFRGLNKYAIIEVDINRREYVEETN